MIIEKERVLPFLVGQRTFQYSLLNTHDIFFFFYWNNCKKEKEKQSEREKMKERNHHKIMQGAQRFLTFSLSLSLFLSYTHTHTHTQIYTHYPSLSAFAPCSSSKSHSGSSQNWHIKVDICRVPNLRQSTAQGLFLLWVPSARLQPKHVWRWQKWLGLCRHSPKKGYIRNQVINRASPRTNKSIGRRPWGSRNCRSRPGDTTAISKFLLLNQHWYIHV